MRHSEDSIMSSGELDNLFDDCVQVLQDSLYLAADLTAQGALARIREVKSFMTPVFVNTFTMYQPLVLLQRFVLS